MTEKELKNVKVLKAGTNYLTIRVPKIFFDRLPNGYFYSDITIKNIRGGKSE